MTPNFEEHTLNLSKFNVYCIYFYRQSNWDHCANLTHCCKDYT